MCMRTCVSNLKEENKQVSMRAREFQYTLPCTKIAIQWRFETTDLMHPHCSSGDPHFIYVQSWQYANIVTIANIFKSESKFAKFCHRTRHTRRFQNIKIIARRRTTRIIIRRFLVHEASPDRVSRLFQIFCPYLICRTQMPLICWVRFDAGQDHQLSFVEFFIAF